MTNTPKLSKPRVLLLTGTCGSGKSTVAALLGRQGWSHISEDDVWKRLFGKERGRFDTDEHRAKRERVHRVVFAFVQAALEVGNAVVIDATVHEAPPEAFQEYREWFEANRIAWALRVLHPALKTAIERDAGRMGWHAGPERVAALHAKFTGAVFNPEVFLDTSADAPQDTLHRILEGLGAGGAPASGRPVLLH